MHEFPMVWKHTFRCNPNKLNKLSNEIICKRFYYSHDVPETIYLYAICFRNSISRSIIELQAYNRLSCALSGSYPAFLQSSLICLYCKVSGLISQCVFSGDNTSVEIILSSLWDESAYTIRKASLECSDVIAGQKVCVL